MKRLVVEERMALKSGRCATRMLAIQVAYSFLFVENGFED